MPRCAGPADRPAAMSAARRVACCSAVAGLLAATWPAGVVGLAAQAWPRAAKAQPQSLPAVNDPDPGSVLRSFPAHALRGTLQVTQPPEVLLNGQASRLSPGARIRGANNLLLVSGALVGQPLLVHYTTDALGQVHLVWVLSADEAARKPWPSTPDQAQRWRFNPSEQRWTQP